MLPALIGNLNWSSSFAYWGPMNLQEDLLGIRFLGVCSKYPSEYATEGRDVKSTRIEATNKNVDIEKQRFFWSETNAT